MRFLIKTFTFVLIFSVLAQQAAAVPTGRPEDRIPLKQVQAKALQDKTWLQEHKVPILTAVSSVSLFAVAVLAIDNVKKATNNKILKRDLRNATQKSLEAQIQAGNLKEESEILIRNNWNQLSQIGLLQKTNKELERKYAASERGRNTLQKNLQQVNHAYNQQRAILKEYEKQIHLLEKQLYLTKNFITKSTAAGLAIEDKINEYAKIFDAEIPLEQRLEIRQTMIQDPFFKNFKKQERKDILRFVDEMSEMLSPEFTAQWTSEGAYHLAPIRIQQYLAKHTSSASRFLLGLGEKIFTKGNLLSAGLVLGLMTLPALQGNAQNSALANRIENKFEFFLNASPEQLEEWEQYEDVYEACVRGAAVQNFLTTLSEEELAEYTQALQQTTPRTQVRVPHLAH